VGIMRGRWLLCCSEGGDGYLGSLLRRFGVLAVGGCDIAYRMD